MYSDASEREADEYELRLHTSAARRGFLLGGLLTALGAAIFLLTGFAYIGLLLVPGIGLLVNAFTHLSQCHVVEARLRDGAAVPTAGVPAPTALGRGAAVIVTWTDGAQHRGVVLQLRGPHYLVELEDGRQHWIATPQVRPADAA